MLNIKELAKWNAWNKLKGMSNEEAKLKYIETVKRILPKDISDKL